VIVSAEDQRDMSNPFRSDWKDGMEYELEFDSGTHAYLWWEIRKVGRKE
jgi:hypothetical protein